MKRHVFSTALSALGVTALVALALLSGVLLAQQTDRDRAEALTRRAGDRLQALQQEADRLATDERTLLGDLRQLEVAREIKAEELRQTTQKASAAARDLDVVDEQVRRLEREDVAERPELRARVVELYKLGQGRYLRLLLSMSDVRSIGQASRMVAALAKRDRDRVETHQRRLGELKASRITLEVRGKELAALHVEAERADRAAAGAVAARNQLIDDIDRQRDLNAQLAGELSTAQQKLQQTLRQLGSGAPAAAGADAASLPLRPFRGDLDWPVAGAVRQRFGRPTSARLPANGIEIAAEEGAPVQAVHGGTVAFAGPFAGFGNLVIVQHDSTSFTLYGNLSAMTVGRGDRVDDGQTLGSVGASATGPPGLYFELRVDGQPVDPVQWLKKR
jgi:septal ring factor EnvC (AmiA/AmiB activator)